MQITTEDGIKITLTESQLAEIQAQIPPKPTYEEGDWVYVNALDYRGKTVFLAQMVSDTAWSIPHNQYTQGLTYSAEVKDIIRPWKPEAGDIVLLTPKENYRPYFYVIAKMYDDTYLVNQKGKKSSFTLQDYAKVEPYIQQKINL